MKGKRQTDDRAVYQGGTGGASATMVAMVIAAMVMVVVGGGGGGRGHVVIVVVAVGDYSVGAAGLLVDVVLVTNGQLLTLITCQFDCVAHIRSDGPLEAAFAQQ